MSGICTFIGHKDCPEDIIPLLYSRIEDLILNGVDIFYVGTHGRFDYYAYKQLIELEKKYDIKFKVVLSCLEGVKGYIDIERTVYPEEIANAMRKFSILKRNEYMIKKSTHLICYINNSFSNSYRFYELALKNKLEVINIGKL